MDSALKATPEDEWHVNLNTAREFYPFWLKDIKAIAAFNLNYGFDVSGIQWKPITASLKTLIDSLKTEKFDTAESWPIKAYTQALSAQGAEQSLVDTRIKLAKVLIIRLRDAPIKNHKSYRTAADLTLPLFNMVEAKQLFLVVVREFYNFWTGNPNAASMLLNNESNFN